jgi:hypothetical protein
MTAAVSEVESVWPCSEYIDKCFIKCNYVNSVPIHLVTSIVIKLLQL